MDTHQGDRIYAVSGYALGCAVVICLLVAGLVGAVVVRPDSRRRAAPTASATPAAVRGPVAIAGQRALDMVTFSPDRIGYKIRFEAAKSTVRAQIDEQNHQITIFVAASDAPHRLAHDIAHELGHAYDAMKLNAATRARYLDARGRAGTLWWPGLQGKDFIKGAVTDYGVGAGDFAEVFALCHAPSPEFRSTLAPEPASPCALIPQ